MIVRAILLGTLAGLLQGGLIRADDSLKLPGGGLKAEDVWLKSDLVFKGEITDAGSPDVTCSAASVGPLNNHVKIKVLQIFRGAVDEQISATMGANEMSHEVMPDVGRDYIFFVEKNDLKDYSFPDPFSVLKVLSASDANIATVNRLSSQPASK